MDEPRYHLGSVVHAKGETLEDFDGPLDVILLLLSKNKIEIQDIQISAILEQYLAYLDEMKRMDMEIASEFIAMASYLMYIKTRMLLSRQNRRRRRARWTNSSNPSRNASGRTPINRSRRRQSSWLCAMSWDLDCSPRGRSRTSRTEPTATGMTSPI